MSKVTHQHLFKVMAFCCTQKKHCRSKVSFVFEVNHSVIFSLHIQSTCICQMTSREEQVKDSKIRQLQDLEQEQRDDVDYEEFLRKETERLKLRGFTPRVSQGGFGASIVVNEKFNSCHTPSSQDTLTIYF